MDVVRRLVRCPEGCPDLSKTQQAICESLRPGKCFPVSWAFFTPDLGKLFCYVPAWFPWPLAWAGRPT